MSQLRELTDNLREFVRTVGAVALFLLRMLGQFPRLVLRPGLIVEQIYNAGGALVGHHHDLRPVHRHGHGPAVLRHLARFGSEDAIGVGAALGLLKELALWSPHCSSPAVRALRLRPKSA